MPNMINQTVPVLVSDDDNPYTYAVIHAGENEKPSVVYCENEDEADKIIHQFERTGVLAIPNYFERRTELYTPIYVLKTKVVQGYKKIYRNVTIENPNVIEEPLQTSEAQKQLPAEGK